MYGKKILQTIIGTSALCLVNHALAASITIPMYLVAAKGHGKSIGSVVAEDVKCGVLLKPNLSDLPPGVHGFHVHVNPSCDDYGMAAGGHFDPQHTNEHEGPYAHAGHKGDLPILIVDKNGKATLPTLAPRLTVADLKGHALMIHAGGDNYSDQPEKLGGGGARIACGIIKS